MAKFKKVKCIVCGKIFEPPVNNAITCSVECRTIRRKEVVKHGIQSIEKGKQKKTKLRALKKLWIRRIRRTKVMECMLQLETDIYKIIEKGMKLYGNLQKCSVVILD